MEASLLIFINILFLATVNAIVLIVLSYRMGTKTYLLGWSLFFYNLFFLVYFLGFHAGWILRFPHFIRAVNPLMFLTGPFFYFYIRNSLLDKTGLSPKDTLHFLPAFLHMLGLLPFYLMGNERNLELAKMFVGDPKTLNLYANGIIPTYVLDSLRIVLMSAYLGYSLWLMYRYNPNWINPFQKEALKNPLSVVAFLFVLITFGYFSYHSFWMLEALSGFQLPGLIAFFTWVTLAAIAVLSIYLHLNPEKSYVMQQENIREQDVHAETPSDPRVEDKAQFEAEDLAAIKRIAYLLTQNQVFLH